MLRVAGIVGLAALLLTPLLRAQESPLLKAMQEEMARSMAGLRLKDQPAPYYIAYALEDAASTDVSATLGAIVTQNGRRGRMLRVEVRVGDYTRDSSRFISFDRDPGMASMLGAGVVFCALDDDMNVIRRQLWLTTDAAYKRAVSVYSKKLAALQNQVTTEPLPDFSRETPLERILPTPAPAAPIGKWAETVRQVSAEFVSPDISSSNVALTVVQGARYFVNSEGFKTVSPLQMAYLRITAETQAEDGMALRDATAAHARTVDQLPAAAELVSRARALAAGLVELRKAPIGDEFTGPVLIEGQAASELLAQTFVPLFLSLRAPDAENRQMMGPMARGPSSPFLTRVGAKILPDAFSVADTPSLAKHESQDVPGAYAVDDEGLPAQDVTLAEKGTLKSLLTSRTPQRGFLNSNGHGRGGGAQAGVFQLSSSSPVSAQQLRANYLARLKQEGRPFGYVVRTLANPALGRSLDADDMMMSMMMGRGPGAQGGPHIVRAMKITPDGKEVLVRGLRLGTVSHTAYRDIVEASEERTLYTYRASMPADMRMLTFAAPGPMGSEVTVSLIAPSLLFSELELEKPETVHQRPPIVPSPLQ